MNAIIKIAPVHKSIVVAASTQRAFEVFTSGIDRWWPKSHGIGRAPIRRCAIEPFVGGRWYNDLEDGSDVTIGHVRVWEPGKRFVVGWEISAQWKPEARVQLASEVEVRFVREAENRTRIEVEHRDFERMGESDGSTMRGAVDGGWPGILELYAKELQRAEGG
ncbi:MAG TPA: SRPBCC family protein [Steroidobacteraceae bacterium]|nr:SRPBCC family protein [Steroidobacteraceae bacterium]